MRVKIGTSLDEGLYRQLQETARARNCRINELIEQAVAQFLAASTGGADLVAETFGSYRVSEGAAREILEEDVYDA